MRLKWIWGLIALAGVACGGVAGQDVDGDVDDDPSEQPADAEDGVVEPVPLPTDDCVSGDVLGCVGDDLVVCDGAGKDRLEPCELGCNIDLLQCNECRPSTVSCGNNETVTCGADGLPKAVETCPAGCFNANRCAEIDPANNLGQFLAETSSAPDVDLDFVTIDTDSGTITNTSGQAVPVPSHFLPAPSGGVPVRVFVAKSLSLGTAIVAGDAAVAFVSDGEIEVFGTVSVFAGELSSCKGASGDNLTDIFLDAGGGAGGGYAARGGAGASVTGGAAGGFLSKRNGNVEIEPLRGGCAGGDGGTGAAGGAGGGAIQLVSRTSILVTGAITAPGEGGETKQAGGGGGSGGAIMLEAPSVSISIGGFLAVNGGGGGCSAGSDGESGLTSVQRAQGGCADAGDGGSEVNTLGDHANTNTFTGGGGSIGRVRINSIDPPAIDGTISGIETFGALPLL